METIEDILKQMRTYIESWWSETPWGYAIAKYADRIEAAYKREMGVSQTDTTTKGNLGVGNGAKCREALEEAKRVLQYLYKPELSPHDCDNRRIADAVTIINAALSAPARNCDLYTNYGDAIRAFEDDEDAESFEDIGEWLFCETEGGAR